jgi:ribosomal 50S subunit-associated protein YjgA (DUF615 family)
MTEMLGMVKHEMQLVNKADSDRDTIDEYMAELDTLHQKQLSMIQSVEEVSHRFISLIAFLITVFLTRFTPFSAPSNPEPVGLLRISRHAISWGI